MYREPLPCAGTALNMLTYLILTTTNEADRRVCRLLTDEQTEHGGATQPARPKAGFNSKQSGPHQAASQCPPHLVYILV